jgi:hypothetical protein
MNCFSSETYLPTIAAVALLISVAGCREAENPREISVVRPIAQHEPSLRADATSAERFGFDRRPVAPPQAADLFDFDKPVGWQELPSTQFRLINLRAGPDDDVECYLSILPGAAGGIAANINRWRRQMGLPGYDKAQLEALASRPMLGTDAVVTAFEGTFSGMGDAPDRKGYRLQGVILKFQGQMLFVKMVGPRQQVETQAAAFEQFCDSLRPAAPSEGSRTVTPPEDAANPTITWLVPPDWRQLERPPGMRLVTFACDPDYDVECYITILAGSAGGSLANINRWQRQMQQPPLTQQAFDDLKRIPILGQDSAMVEIGGDYTGMSEDTKPDAMMAGIVCPLATNTIFIKMIGPHDATRAQLDSFVALAESLQHKE